MHISYYADLLAKGGHGAVYCCTSNGQQIAVKVFDSATADAAKREVSAVSPCAATETQSYMFYKC